MRFVRHIDFKLNKLSNLRVQLSTADATFVSVVPFSSTHVVYAGDDDAEQNACVDAYDMDGPECGNKD